MKLKEVIEKIQEELKHHIPYLNHGGCIHFAYYFSNVLDLLNIDYKIYALNCDTIGRTYNTFAPVNHIVVFIDGIGFVDGHVTEVNPRYKCKCQIKLNPNVLRKQYRWNNYYDIEDNKVIKEVLKKYFNDYTGK